MTTVPIRSTAAVTAAMPVTRTGKGRRSSGCPTPGSRERSHSVVARATRTAETRKCAATIQGLSSVSTVTPPSIAWAATPTKLHTASARRSRRGERKTATSSAIAMTPRTPVSVRLPNSITPCTASSGVFTKLSSVQRGQVGQPRPEPVRRTAPPVTTMAPLATALARATREMAAGEKAVDRTGTPRC